MNCTELCACSVQSSYHAIWFPNYRFNKRNMSIFPSTFDVDVQGINWGKQ